MLGFAGLDVALAYWLCLVSAAVCVVYGVVHWNDRVDSDPFKMRKIILPKRARKGRDGDSAGGGAS
ncbi:symporter small accessory protein [Desulfohalovibrio reitneri]|uniref:symporter small accessory protein n=1 Tax=Desulfohalovibrio reitneri TaxID=1307759 RepID=UPI00069205BD|nr:symporter small accessory protein [Desulfohalovibrio reitneri]